MTLPHHLTRYTCPLLMWVQWLALRALRRPVVVRDGTIFRRLPTGAHGEESCRWPDWMVLAEWRARKWITDARVRLTRG